MKIRIEPRRYRVILALALTALVVLVSAIVYPSVEAALTGQVRKGTIESVSNTTTLQSDNDLTISLTPSKAYLIQGILFVSTNNIETNDVKLGFTFPTGAVADIGFVTATGDSGVLQVSGGESEVIAWGGGPSEILPIQIMGTIQTVGSGGNLTVQWAPGTLSSASTSVLRGSFLRIEDI